MFLCASDLLLNYAVKRKQHDDHVIFYAMESSDEICANKEHKNFVSCAVLSGKQYVMFSMGLVHISKNVKPCCI